MTRDRRGSGILRVGFGGLAALAVAVPMACQVIGGFERVEEVEREAGTAPPPPVGDDPCVHARPPAAPTTDDAPDASLDPFYVAVRTFALTPPSGQGFGGFDLDNTCTCDTRSGSAHDGGSSCKAVGNDCDLDGGIDNTAARLFAAFSPPGFTVDDLINASVNSGARSLIFYVEGYNGKANDPHVTVAAMVTNGILDGTGCGTVPVLPDGGEDSGLPPKAPPGWCGHDLWTYSSAFTKIGTKIPVGTVDGYVSNHTIVFQSSDAITLYLGSQTAALGSPLISAALEQDDAGIWTMAGNIGGRVVANDLLVILGNFGIGAAQVPLCTNNAFSEFRSTICKSADIASVPNHDFGSGACDAISFALTFSGVQADIGKKYDEAAQPGICAPGNVEAGFYACP